MTILSFLALRERARAFFADEPAAESLEAVGRDYGGTGRVVVFRFQADRVDGALTAVVGQALRFATASDLEAAGV